MTAMIIVGMAVICFVFAALAGKTLFPVAKILREHMVSRGVEFPYALALVTPVFGGAVGGLIAALLIGTIIGDPCFGIGGDRSECLGRDTTFAVFAVVVTAPPLMGSFLAVLIALRREKIER